MRRDGSRELLVIVPRRLGKASLSAFGDYWRATHIPRSEGRNWKNLLTGAALEVSGGKVGLEKVFAELPIGVFLSL